MVIGQLECHKEKKNEIPVEIRATRFIENQKYNCYCLTLLMCQKEVITKIAKDNNYRLLTLPLKKGDAISHYVS